jgi:hypothetical protein
MGVAAAGAAAGCGGTSTDDTPAGLPAVIPFGGLSGPAFYDRPVKVSNLPPGVTKTGGILRTGGVAYAPDEGGSRTPVAIWIVKDGNVWKYSLDPKVKHAP